MIFLTKISLWLISKTSPSPYICYHAEFGRSALKHVGINTGEPQKFGSPGTSLSWDGRRGWTQDTRISPICVTTSMV